MIIVIFIDECGLKMWFYDVVWKVSDLEIMGDFLFIKN